MKIMNEENIKKSFCGKVVILGGVFKQILLVVKKPFVVIGSIFVYPNFFTIVMSLGTLMME